MEQAALLELLAGKRNASVLAAILQAPEQLEAAYEDAQNAEGSALRENEEYLDSIQGKIDQFNNAVQTMWSSTLESDTVKDIVEFGTELVKIIDKIGLFKGLIIAIGTYMMAKHNVTDGLFGLFSPKSIEDATGDLKQMQKTLGELKTDMDNAVMEDSEKKTEKSHKKATEAKERYSNYKTKVEEVEKENLLNEKAKERIELQKQLNAAEEKYNKGLDILNGPEQDGSIAVEAFDEMSNLDEKIKQNGMSIEDAKKRMEQFGNTTDQTGKKGSKAFNKIGSGVKKFGKQLAGAISSMMMMYAITTVLELGGKLLSSIGEWVKGLSESPEEAHEKFENLNNELQATESELDSLKSELKTTKDRIDELLEKDNLSIVEKDELSKLQQTNRELEHQIKLNETLSKQQRQSVNDASFNAVSKYYSQTSFYSEKTKSEREEEAKEIGNTIGSTAGMIIGGIIGTMAGGQTVVGAGIGATLGGALGGAAGEAIESNAYLSELSVEEAINNMGLLRVRLKKDISAAEQTIADNNGKVTEKQRQALQEARQALADFDSNMANSMSQMQQYINAIDYSSLTDPKEQQKYRDILDDVLKYNIEMGVQGAETNAISTMLSEDLITDEFKRVQEIVVKALDVNEDINYDYLINGGFNDEDQKNIDAVKTRLESVGSTTAALIAYFKELKTTEQETMEYETSDVVKEVLTLTNGINLLKEAFDEFNESGVVTAETLIKLNEVFGETDGWKEYIDIMSSGAASVQEVIDTTNQLAENWIVDRIDDPFKFATFTGEYDKNGKKIFEQNKSAYQAYITEIQQLGAIGVTNARELVDAAQQKGLVQMAVNTIKEVQRIEALGADATPEELAWLEKNRKDSAEAYAEAVYEAYGVQVKNTDLVNEQFELSKSQDDLKIYDDYRDIYFDVSDNNLTKFAKSIQQSKSLLDQIADFEQQKENYTLDVAYEDGTFWENVLDTFAYGPDKAGTTKRSEKFDELNGYIADANDALNVEIAERQRLWDDLVNIANEEGLDNIGIDSNLINQFDPNDLSGDSVFNQVYEAVRVYLYGEDGNGGKVAELKAEEAKIIEKLDTAFDSIGLEVILELQDKNQLVDDIQSIYDELSNAQKEYAENGYVTVDTMQTLFKLEPKYLDLLVDENGKLDLNKTSLLKVARARILDLGYKQQSTILENAWALASQGSTDAMREQILVMEQATEKEKDWIKTQMTSIRTALDKRVAAKEMTKAEADAFYTGTLNQVKAVQTTMDLALSDLENTLSSSGNTAAQEAEDAFKKAMDYWENRIGANQSLYEQIQNDIDLLEKKGQIAGESYYQAQINVEKEHLAHLKEQRKEATAFLKKETPGTERWWEIANVLNDIEGEIDDVTSSIQDLSDAMDQVHWTIFDEAHERMEDLTSQLSNVREILSADEDSFFTDEGEWAENGIAVVATYVQEIELAKNKLADVNKELSNLSMGDFDSEQEYYDKLTELTEKQQDYTMAISDSEQAVVDMYESNIDAVEEYTQTLIDSYNDYIDSVKEALDAERDYTLRKQSYSPLYIEIYIMYSFELLENP